jgi:hypothetical protein
MSARSDRGADRAGGELAPELAAVRDAARRLLEAQVAREGESHARAAVTEAAKRALDAGHAVSAVAAAEDTGQRLARDEARGPLLREVQRTAKRLREITREHEDAVARAAHAGLSAREIAQRADMAHATVGAIVRRREAAQPADTSAAQRDGAHAATTTTETAAGPTG